MTRRPAPRDRGFSFVELLAYMAIAALLVMAAIPQYAQFRIRADVNNAQSDLRNAASAMEGAVDASGNYPATLPTSVRPTRGIQLSVIPGASDAQANLAAFLAACQSTGKYRCVISDGEHDLADFGVTTSTNGVTRLREGDLLIVNNGGLSAGFRAGTQFLTEGYAARQIVLAAAGLADGWFLPTVGAAVAAPAFCLNASPDRAPTQVWSYSPSKGIRAGSC